VGSAVVVIAVIAPGDVAVVVIVTVVVARGAVAFMAVAAAG
jgi:hypothetical protein